MLVLWITLDSRAILLKMVEYLRFAESRDEGLIKTTESLTAAAFTCHCLPFDLPRPAPTIPSLPTRPAPTAPLHPEASNQDIQKRALVCELCHHTHLHIHIYFTPYA